MRTRKSDIEDIQACAEELIELIDTVATGYDGDVLEELRIMRRYASIVAEKAPKTARLRDFKGYKFAIICETNPNEPRVATYDEAMRLIMGYQKGNVIDIYREWTVVNGEWVKRPLINPDGTERKKGANEQ